MKKQLLLFIPAIIIFALLYFWYSSPKGNTIESRESILDAAISNSEGWTIAKEIEIDGYIISAAYSADHKSTLAIFEPAGNGTYQFKTSTTRDSKEIIIGGASINGIWYDLIWFDGAKTEYAEVTYTVGGQTQNTLKYNTNNLVRCCFAPVPFRSPCCWPVPWPTIGP